MAVVQEVDWYTTNQKTGDSISSSPSRRFDVSQGTVNQRGSAGRAVIPTLGTRCHIGFVYRTI